MIKVNDKNIEIRTNNTSLILEIKSFDDFATPYILGRKYLTLFYYGDKNSEPKFEPSNQLINVTGACDDYCYDLVMDSSFGDGNNVEGSILIKNFDGSFVNRFFFQRAEIIDGEISNNLPHSRDVCKTLAIYEEDIEAGLELVTYYSLFEDSDVICVKRKIINHNSGSIFVRNFASLQLPIKTKELEIFTYDGSWLFERTRHSTKINSGVFMNESTVFSSSHKHNPFIQIADNTNEKFYAFNLIWSGNHKEFIDLDSVKENAIVSVGINSYTFDYEVKANEEFFTPEAIMCIGSTLEKTSEIMRSFVTNHIVNKKWMKTRPILFNSWEGSEFNINDKKLFEMADVCKDVGIELFVIDDGWFGKRNDDLSSLGDWFVNEEKFPNGFDHTANVIRSKGLQFGFWIEPEMISIKSELFKTHPEFACLSKSREPIERRHQLMIDMSNPNVVDYLVGTLSKVIESTKPTYIKWDFNRNMTEAYSSYGTPAGEFMFKYVTGLYDLMRRLTEKFPDVMFSGCSSGGGRYDLGVLYFMPQIQGSDTTNAYCRTLISCGTYAGYPQNSYGAHVSRDYCPIRGESHFSSLDNRFNIHFASGFGYEFDVTKLPEEDLKTIKNQIAFFKKYRELAQFGELVIVDNVFDNKDYYSYQITSKDKKEALYILAQTRPGVAGKTWKFVGLESDTVYDVKMRNHSYVFNFSLPKSSYTGKELMEDGIAFPSLDLDENTEGFDGVFSRLLVLTSK